MIRFQCPSCGVVMKAGDDAAGKTGKCKRCGVAIVVPPPLGGLESDEFDDVLAATRAAMGSHPAQPGNMGEPSDPGFAVALPEPPEDDLETDKPTLMPIPRTYQPPPSSPSRRMPREPWCYFFLELFGGLRLALGLVLGGLQILAGVAGLVGATVSTENEMVGSAILGFPVLLVSGLVTIFVVGLLGAPALIIVDMARNIRCMRYER